MLFQLPTPPPGKTGWPWTEETPQLPETMPDGSPWPRISIVTPSFNQGQFIEETIRSVLLQCYPNLEYIIIDGGSTDNSVEIIRRYEPWLAYWVSEPDQGQGYAINRGFEWSTGEIMAWINSDDFYAPAAFKMVAEVFIQSNKDWVAGNCYTLELDGRISSGRGNPEPQIETWFVSCPYAQPGIFWKRSLWEGTNKIDVKLHYSFDYELWLQFAQKQLFPYWIESHLAFFRKHHHSKTVANKKQFIIEDRLIYAHHGKMIKSLYQKIKIMYLQRVNRANYYLSSHYHSDPVMKKILLALYYAPWYIFRWQFYYKLKVFIFG